MTKAERKRMDDLETRIKDLEDTTWKIVTYPAQPGYDPFLAARPVANAGVFHSTTVHGDVCCQQCGQVLPQQAALSVTISDSANMRTEFP